MENRWEYHLQDHNTRLNPLSLVRCPKMAWRTSNVTVFVSIETAKIFDRVCSHFATKNNLFPVILMYSLYFNLARFSPPSFRAMFCCLDFLSMPFILKSLDCLWWLTHWRSILPSHRNHSIDLLSKSVDWFLSYMNILNALIILFFHSSLELTYIIVWGWSPNLLKL